MTQNFTPDPKIQQVAEAYALDCIDFAKDHFKVDLDWSDDSLSHIEAILDVLHSQLSESAPSESQVYGFAKMLGSYVGEVFRKNHGASWGVVQLGEETMPGLQTERECRLFWPWGKAHNRIINGPEDNILYYYQVLVHECGSPSPSLNTPSPPGRSWWSRLRGA